MRGRYPLPDTRDLSSSMDPNVKIISLQGSYN